MTRKDLRPGMVIILDNNEELLVCNGDYSPELIAVNARIGRYTNVNILLTEHLTINKHVYPECILKCIKNNNGDIIFTPKVKQVTLTEIAKMFNLPIECIQIVD